MGRTRWAAANFVALPIGPILGGWLLSNYWWGWVFLMNLPVVAVGLAVVEALAPESRAGSAAVRAFGRVKTSVTCGGAHSSAMVFITLNHPKRSHACGTGP